MCHGKAWENDSIRQRLGTMRDMGRSFDTLAGCNLRNECKDGQKVYILPFDEPRWIYGRGRDIKCMAQAVDMRAHTQY